MWGVLGFLVFADYQVALILQIISVIVAIAENFLD